MRRLYKATTMWTNLLLDNVPAIRLKPVFAGDLYLNKTHHSAACYDPACSEGQVFHGPNSGSPPGSKAKKSWRRPVAQVKSGEEEKIGGALRACVYKAEHSSCRGVFASSRVMRRMMRTSYGIVTKEYEFSTARESQIGLRVLLVHEGGGGRR